MRWMIVILSLLFLEAGGNPASRPALDDQVPAHLETAVFSMG